MSPPLVEGHASRPLAPWTRGATLPLLLFILLALLLRLPLILSGNLLPDGDECILGLMAKHLLDEGSVRLHLYGQHYGFALLETATAALFYAVLGVSPTSLNLAMLALWIAGAWLLVLAARSWKGDAAGTVTAVALLAMPAWAAWSMKASGVYLGAFLLFALTVRLVAWIAARPTGGRAALAAAVSTTGLIALTQPLWLAAIAPFWGYLFVAAPRTRRAIPALLVLLATALALMVGPGGDDAYWRPQAFADPQPARALALLLPRIATSFSGAHVYTDAVSLGPGCTLSGILGAALCVLQVAVGARLAVRRRFDGPLLAASAGIVLSAAATLALNNGIFGYRYLLALPTLSALWLGLAAGLPSGKTARRAGLLILLLLAATGAVAHGEFRRFTGTGVAAAAGEPEPASMRRLIAFLRGGGIGHAYSLDPSLQWTVTFLSGEDVVCRWLDPRDRFPRYPREVDAAFAAGRPTALVAWADQSSEISGALARSRSGERRVALVDGRFLVLTDPPLPLLQELGFRFSGPGRGRSGPR